MREQFKDLTLAIILGLALATLALLSVALENVIV